MSSSAASTSPKTLRLVLLTAALVAAAALIAVYVLFWMQSPATVAARETPARAELTLQTVGALGPRYKHADWVSYLVQNEQGEWVHSTDLTVPANSLVRVTIHQYDSATGLRNPFFARVQGVEGDVIRLDGKPINAINPNLTSHTFAFRNWASSSPLRA